jgi:hypothetical protein
MLAVDDEQNASDQGANSCDDVEYCAKPHAEKSQTGNDQKNSEQNPFQSIHIFLLSLINALDLEVFNQICERQQDKSCRDHPESITGESGEYSLKSEYPGYCERHRNPKCNNLGFTELEFHEFILLFYS